MVGFAPVSCKRGAFGRGCYERCGVGGIFCVGVDIEPVSCAVGILVACFGASGSSFGDGPVGGGGENAGGGFGAFACAGDDATVCGFVTFSLVMVLSGFSEYASKACTMLWLSTDLVRSSCSCCDFS